MKYHKTKPHRILIANRGEIAVRIARAARELGHIPLGIYSTADRRCLHVAKCDEAYCVGNPPSNQSYLNAEEILKAAKIMKADAVHPGYGFLSENSKFADMVEKAGLIYIGPPAKVIATMGDKVAARKTMEKAGLPVIPGSKQGTTDENIARKRAKSIGYPIMIKALAGGGGRGMRLVEKDEDFTRYFRRATSEAKKSFGDGTLYLEKYITAPHHIEVQILGDKFGNVCHLYERECSVQRRHQKLIEESPSPFLTPEVRKRICKAAVKAAKNINYVNAGTIEFLVDAKQHFYFMEMNTRLQVEHPVTEWITGIDIVKEQIQIAFGQRLSFKQKEIHVRGHAIEYRIYAEDPEKMMPQAGRLTGISFPIGSGVRVDSHAYRGYDVPVFYDSMLAKLSVWGRNRDQALARSRAALKDTLLNGIRTNVPLHLQLCNNEKFISGIYTTRLIDDDFTFKAPELEPEQLKMALIAVAVSAFAKEFQGEDPQKAENPRWKLMARAEALRK